MGMSTFATLPIELLQRIATFLPCPSAFCLVQVSHYLREACNDPLVYKGIIENGNGRGILPVRSWPQHLSIDAPVDIWAQYALADYLVLKEVEKGEWGMRSFESDWLPILMATNHPIIADIPLTALELNCLTEDDYVAALPQTVEENIRYRFHIGFCSTISIMHKVCADLEQIPSTALAGYAPLSPLLYYMGDYPIYYGPLGPFFFEILRRRRENTLNNPNIGIFDDQPAGSLWIPPPSFRTVPITKLLDLDQLVPFPLETPSMVSFRTSHVDKMVNKQFLEDSEWVGYYGYEVHGWEGMEDTDVRIDPPMTDIKLQVVKCEPDNMIIAGTGQDPCGLFTLDGHISRHDGCVHIIKKYAAGFSWKWGGWMSPFGIVGVWGQPEDDHLSDGPIWLWKKEWGDADFYTSVVPKES
ncbi:hypothetical protein DL96DRAFT_1629624 [Flagelloscypha sp. PMI_526]|nr:hypothetical protein DL96DRAFT_1629624 [Flagelloscypha sp. PMI_526]